MNWRAHIRTSNRTSDSVGTHVAHPNRSLYYIYIYIYAAAATEDPRGDALIFRGQRGREIYIYLYIYKYNTTINVYYIYIFFTVCYLYIVCTIQCKVCTILFVQQYSGRMSGPECQLAQRQKQLHRLTRQSFTKNQRLHLCLQAPCYIFVSRRVFLAAQSVADDVEVLRRVDTSKEHVVVALDDEPVRRVDLADGGQPE